MADNLTLDRQAMKDRSTAHLRIYVGGLTENATVEELYDQFIQFGQINGIVINRNFGFIQFENESSAQAAIAKANGSIYQGKSLNVRTAQQNSDRPRRDMEVIVTKPDIPPAVALTENMPTGTNDEGGDDVYDNYGNYVGDQNRDEEYEYDDGYDQNLGGHEDVRGGTRGGMHQGRGGAGRGRGMRGRGRGGPPGFRERSPIPGRDITTGGDWPKRDGYDRYPQPAPEYPRAVPVLERNDCEIIVVSKALTEYAEYIEGRLKRLGIVVDLLFPMEDVPIGKVLGNIASRGCLYAILVMPQNQENRSLTLTILHGLPQEHRNMPLEDALQLLSRNFQEVQRGGPSGREAVYALLGQLADGRTLTVLQYDKVIEYLQERKEQQVKIELGEPLTPAPSNKTQADLQQRILSILNDKKVVPQNTNQATPILPVATPIKTPTPTPLMSANPAAPPSQNKLLNDPSVRKALDSILQKFT